MRRVAMLMVAAPIATLAACGSSSSAGSSDKTAHVLVSITDEGCSPAELTTPAGPTTFEVTNKGAAGVTEFEVLDGTKILGEAENVASGLSGKFTLTLKEGSFVTYCPGGTKNERGVLTVGPGTANPATADSTAMAQAAAAVAAYRAFLERKTALLTTDSKLFTDAVRSGDVDTSKSMFASARAPYEAIEPVAESFGDLDPLLDAREGDVSADQWTGFHAIEKHLWVDGAITDATKTLATGLDANIATLVALVNTVELEPAQIANGAVELLGEVSSSKITGEEDRYSHTDLSDFEANVEGAYEAYLAVKPIIADRASGLETELSKRFGDVTNKLKTYKTGSGGTYISYTALTPADTKALADLVDALGVPLSKVAAAVA